MLAICFKSGVATFYYPWVCGEGCCSNLETRENDVVFGKIYELGDDYPKDRVPHLLAPIPDGFVGEIKPNYYLDEDGWIQVS